MKVGFYDSPETKWLTVGEIKERGMNPEKSYAYLLSPLHYQPENGPLITAPPGYITDFASVPRIFWTLFPPYDPYYGAPAIIHDFGYSTQGTFLIPNFQLSRAGVDHLFLGAMKIQDTEWWRREIIYRAMRLGGGFVWSKRSAADKDWFSPTLGNLR